MQPSENHWKYCTLHIQNLRYGLVLIRNPFFTLICGYTHTQCGKLGYFGTFQKIWLDVALSKMKSKFSIIN